MNKSFYKKVGTFITAFGLLLWILAGFSLNAYAADPEDGSLQLVCKSDDEIISGMKWNLFYAGSREGNGFSVGGDFLDYKISFADISAEGLSDIASTLENYVILDRMKPLQSGITDSSGVLNFTGLQKGLYLLCGRSVKIDKTTYVPIPFIVEIGRDNDGTNQNHITYPKFFHFSVLDQRDADYTVKKVWRNDENQPPDTSVQITVEMYKNGEYDSTVILDESNDWTYTWIDKAHTDWRVKEINIPDDYTVIYRSNETQYAIVNTHKDFKFPPSGDITDITTSTTLTTTTTNTTDINNNTDTTNNNITETTTILTSKSDISSESDTVPKQSTLITTTSEKLPQTGQLWWPVPLLAGAGIIFISIGLRIRSRK